MTKGSVGDFLTELALQRGASPHTLDAYRRDLARLTALAGEIEPMALKPPQLRRGLMSLHAQVAGAALHRAHPVGLAQLLRLAGAARRDRVEPGGRPAPAQARAQPAQGAGHRPGRGAARPPGGGGGGGQRTLLLRDAAMFELLYSSGLRLAELVSLDWPGGLDLAQGEVTVTGKRRKTRTVPVGDKARAALQAWLAVRPQLLRGEQAALFLGRNGTRLTPRQVESRLARWAQRQGVGVHVHPHMLRHSFASHVLQSSGDLRAVQEMLGHASIAATQIYTHLDFQHLAKIYDAAHPRAKSK
jgi:integrase/recombinase XerC